MLAVDGHVRAHWTDQIHDEWMRSVRANRPDLPAEALERTRLLMDRALPDARITGYERHIERLSLPDPDDRHVVVAAIEASADAIVTFNRKDFPEAALAPLALEVLHPDALLIRCIEAHPDGVLETLRTHRRTLRRPPLSPAAYIESLKRAGLDQTVHWMAAQIDHL